MFKKVLIANRGAIACRIERTLRAMGIYSVAIYSDVDADARHVLEADEAIPLGAASATESYLAIEKIIAAAVATGAEAIHPGYGFLSENLHFARACEAAGIRFIGPRPSHIEAFALKHRARELARGCEVPLLPGTEVLHDAAEATTAAESIGYPILLKSSAGGGGIGMRVCRNSTELLDAFDSVTRMAEKSFRDGSVFLEKYVERAKHVEAQIFGDGRGNVIALGLRDCSAQRRHQKVIEETPVPGLREAVRHRIEEAAVRLCASVGYASAGTVEFLFDTDTEAFYFLEVNTRLQVEHGITEQVTGLDLVACMVQEAAGELPPIETLSRPPVGAAIEARIYAEDPHRNFMPAPGLLTHVVFPADAEVRVDGWVVSGTEVSPYYDPMLAKIIVTGSDREDALRRLEHALEVTTLAGTETNLRYLRQVVRTSVFQRGAMTTTFLNEYPVHRKAIEVLDGGMQTTVQDYPGRAGYWHVGVPPSGPMDDLSFRLVNRLVGNPGDTAALEMTNIGARIRFDADTTIAIGGADMCANVDGDPIPMWTPIAVSSGSVLECGAVRGAGARCYLALRGGVDVPAWLGSRSTFMLGRFGGHAGRALRAGDVLHLGADTTREHAASPCAAHAVVSATNDFTPPEFVRTWQIAVLYGPHGAPEFFTNEDITMIFATEWQVHYQSDRTGVRLVGPAPQWARKDGGEAGLHPSNIHDNAYAIGSIDFTGDMPILLGPDGPSLGGFVCPGVIVEAERWKLGQLKAGDTVRFLPVSLDEALRLEQQQLQYLATLAGSLPQLPASATLESPVVKQQQRVGPGTVYRADGDKYLLVEYGPRVLDLALRFRVHLLESRLRTAAIRGIIDITPGVRSLQIHYDSRILSRDALLEALDAIDCDLPDHPQSVISSRIVHLPLSWDDPATRMAQLKYMQAVRPDAPWCPDNIEFIRRINGLGSVDDVYRTVFGASYLVLGLGDVYLGAPVATPIDPRQRLVTTKYNPARTWTPENAVGIGGAYMCIYGMEGPGGYQLVGRTVPVWNTYRVTPTFEQATPWSLRCFDEIRFYPVSTTELTQLRREILHGSFNPRVEQASFSLNHYESFLAENEAGIAAFRAVQREAFAAERERWRINGQLEPPSTMVDLPPASDAVSAIPDGWEAVTAPMAANVFQLAVQPGQSVRAGQKLVVLDAMKMEVVITSPGDGVVRELLCEAGQLVGAGQQLALIAIEAAE